MSEKRTLRDRRLLHPVPIEKRKRNNVFVIPMDYGLRNRLLDWMDDHTTGDFYIGSQLLYFCEDSDVTMYLLSGMDDKVDKREL